MQANIKPFLVSLPALLITSLALAQSTPAGPAVPSAQASQQAVIVEQMITRQLFNNDGTGTRTNEMRVKVLSPAGVQALGQLAFGYNSDSEQLAIDFVRVRKPNGQVISTSIENAPEVSLQISPEAPVYTDFRQKHISVAALSPGDTLEYKITTTVLHPLAGDQFWLSHSFNRQAQVEDERLVVEVPKGREIKIKSIQPYSTEDTATARVYTWKSSNVPKESSKKSSDKEESEPEPAVPDVQLSTFRSWQEVAAWYDGLLLSRISPTPELKAKALELTKGATGTEEKARRLYNFVSQNIRYVSLSFGVGRFQPHSAEEVLHNDYGDCKDKHALLAALLRTAGINSHAVLIHSHNELDRDVPAPSQFDHLITAAEIDGKRIWLDATVGVAPFGVIVPPLRGKQALLVAPDIPDPLVWTPEVPPIPSVESSALEGRFDEAGNLEADFTDLFEGDSALPLRLAARQTAQAEWKDLVQRISYFSGFAGDVSQVKIENVESPDLPLKLTYHYSRKSYFSPDERDRTLGRNTLPLPPVAPDADSVAKLKKNAQLRLGGPLRLNQKLTLHFAKQQNPMAPISVSVHRDYGTYTSKYELKGDQLSVERAYAITAPSVPVTRERDLRAFLTAVNQDTGQQLVVKLSPGAVDAATESSTDAVKLNQAAQARLDVNDYKGAEQFALKAVQADPQSPYAWNNLGLAYLGEGNQLDKAESAFRKQIEINPYDEYAYNNLGRLLRRLNRSDEAVAAFRKQIEIVPLDKWAHKNLGMTLLVMKKYGDAIAELEKAAQITPDDAQLKFSLAAAYQISGDKQKADALLAKLPSPTRSAFPGSDLYNVAISDDEDPEAALQEARQGLQRMEDSFKYNEAGDRGNGTANAVSASWAAMGWAYFRENQLDNAERYLNAAWVMSQSAAVARRLGQVYEKQNKKSLAVRTYTEAMSAEGSREGVRESLLRLVGDSRKADAMTATARANLSASRTVTLTRKAAKSGSASLLLIFSHSQSPDKVVFTEGMPALVDRYEAAVKAQKFPILYPDDTPQHIVRAGLMYCGAAGCSLVLVPPSARQSSTEIPALARHR